MSEEDFELSPAGQSRRQNILRLARDAALSRKRKRHVLQVGSVVCLMVAIAIVWSSIRSTTYRFAQKSPPLPERVEYAIVQTDPTIAARLALPAEPPRWTEINEDQLLKELADAGQPAGIIQMDGESILVPR